MGIAALNVSTAAITTTELFMSRPGHLRQNFERVESRVSESKVAADSHPYKT